MHGPEWHIRKDLCEFLETRHWLVEKTHGSAYQQGLPDLFIGHRYYGQRWIDVKCPGKYSFTKAQKGKWPLWELFNVGVWILTAATETEYLKLMQPPNYRDYWKPSWGTLPTLADIDAALDEVTCDN